ncbi:MAG TPA: alpha/beta hydrolase domain-containing protein [Candidatus Dormibacteraeota bacterium]|nr:alpha/beta hydrolase domain-containing protein [Candidatus Dormibacteraeota bacterium]
MIEQLSAGHAAHGACNRRLAVAAAAIATLLGSTRMAAGQACIADCDRDGRVTVAELITGVNVLLGSAELAQCPRADCNHRGDVSVNCLVQGVNAAVAGCLGVASPAVEGPVTGGSGAPFVASTNFDFADVGYVQSEWFLSGTARSFRNDHALGEDGKWAVRDGDRASYKTRVIVDRPIDPSDFNGTVYVEWLNVSGGLDAGPDFANAHTEIIREGAAWVGLSAQKVGVEGGTAAVGVIDLPLKKIDPVRYASLSHPGDSFSYDIFSQAGQAIRDRAGIAPLDELNVQRIIALGESQSAFRFVTYINAIHRSARVYDGYLVHSRGGIGVPLSEAPQDDIPVPSTAPVRDDLDVPTLIFETETDLTFLNYLAARQPDSERVRTWEVAGTSHVDTYTVVNGPGDTGNSIEFAKLLITKDPVPGLLTCSEPINSGPQHFVLNAAVAALERWVRDGTPPPVSPRLEVDAGPPPAIVRDARGIALGGIRTPAVDVPLAVLSGDPQMGSLFCSLFGTTTPFDAATLTTLYGDTATYAAAVAASTAGAVDAGFILPPDAALIDGAAEDTPIGQ